VWVTRTRFSRGILESAVKLQSAAQSAAKFTMRTGATGGRGEGFAIAGMLYESTIIINGRFVIDLSRY